MLTIRLTRKGKKNQPFFRVVLVDKRRSSKGGRAVEELGYVDRLNKRKNLKKERIQYWISKGAQPSSTIHNILVTEKIIDKPKINLFKKSKKAKEAEAKAAAEAAAAAAAPAPVAEEATPAPEATPETPAETPKEEPKAEEAKPEEPKA